MDQTPKLITIDGPSASGKSSIGKFLSKKLNWPWVSTGVFYRGLALLCLEKDIIDLKELESFFFQKQKTFPETEFLDKKSQKTPWENSSVKILTELTSDPCWKVRMDKEETRVFINGKNRTGDIFSEKIALLASNLSQIPQVRQALLKPQRDCFIPDTGLVAEGRDCGTVIFPQAKIKIYLTANEETRATRRYQQQENKGTHHHRQQRNTEYKNNTEAGTIHPYEREENNLRKTLKVQTLRDKQDSVRKTAPLTKPQGAFVIDSTLLNTDEVVRQVLDYAQTRGIYQSQGSDN